MSTKEYNQEYGRKNAEKIRAQKIEYRRKNSNKIKEYGKKRYKANLERIRDYQLKKDFGISLAQYNSMLDAQQGKCNICGKLSDDGRNFAVDHCHKTGKVRSLLCRGCNVGIGNLKENPILLEKAAEYIRKFRNKNES